MIAAEGSDGRSSTRLPAETFARWVGRAGGAKVLAETLRDLDVWPEPEVQPELYVDFGETGPYAAEVGEGECAAS